MRFIEKEPRGDFLPGFIGQIGLPRCTLNDKARGGKSRRKAHEKEQILPPAIENALEMWAQKMVSLLGLTFLRQWHRSLRSKMQSRRGIPSLDRHGWKPFSTFTPMFPRSSDLIWTVNVHWQVAPSPLSSISIT